MTKLENTVWASRAGKYLTFQLGGEVFGLEILKVQEIIGMMKVTRVPKTPNYVSGVINLRGKVISIIDLRLKFDMASQEVTEKTCIIIVQVLCKAQKVIMGIIVDEVSEVLNIEIGQIEPTPSFGSAVDTDFILGMGKVGQKVLTMLDIDKVLSSDEVALVESAAEGLSNNMTTVD